MKKIAAISFLFLLTICLYAYDFKNIEEPSPYASLSSYTNGASANLIFPWSDNPRVNMEKVYSKGQYSLWKCKSQNVNKFPGCKIKGKTFNYFVYKKGKFHMTVTEMNKNCVFEFFTAQVKKKELTKNCN